MRQQITEQLLRDVSKLEKKYSLSYARILEIIGSQQEIRIPVSIFNEKLGSLESVVKYLKENLGLSIKRIALILNRKEQSVRTTYLRAVSKLKGRLDVSSYRKMPASILRDREKSVLESMVDHFLDGGFTIYQIASVLKRSYKTIWTIKDRIMER